MRTSAASANRASGEAAQLGDCQTERVHAESSFSDSSTAVAASTAAGNAAAAAAVVRTMTTSPEAARRRHVSSQTAWSPPWRSGPARTRTRTRGCMAPSSSNRLVRTPAGSCSHGRAARSDRSCAARKAATAARVAGRSARASSSCTTALTAMLSSGAVTSATSTSRLSSCRSSSPEAPPMLIRPPSSSTRPPTASARATWGMPGSVATTVTSREGAVKATRSTKGSWVPATLTSSTTTVGRSGPNRRSASTSFTIRVCIEYRDVFNSATYPVLMTTTAEPQISARRQATRERVLEAASEVFAERGFHGATVEDICERAGFTRGAFYSNFSSKDDLVLELSRRHAENLVERIRRASKREHATAEEVLRDVFAALADDSRSKERWLVLTTEFTLHAIRDANARRAWAAQQRRVRDELVTVVDEAVARKGQSLPIPTELFVLAAMSLAQGSMTQRLVEPSSLSVGELERTVLPILLGVNA